MGAFAELDHLIALQYEARGFSLLHSQPVHSILFGKRASHVRGRGLDFEELRGYVPGDDVRSIDWRVTARMRKPYVRVYSEERDRPTMLLVDQRINMFFGSKVSMKSVIAAEFAALAVWRAFHQDDRVGAIIFNDIGMEQVRMHRSRTNVLRILDGIVRKNHSLRADLETQPRSAALNDALTLASRTCKHDALIIIASDFDGANEVTKNLLMDISRANDVICCLTYDPLSVSLSAADPLVASSGGLQAELLLQEEKFRKNVIEAMDRRIEPILAWKQTLGIPVIPLSTAEDVPQQIRHLIGGKLQVERRR